MLLIVIPTKDGVYGDRKDIRVTGVARTKEEEDGGLVAMKGDGEILARFKRPDWYSYHREED